MTLRYLLVSVLTIGMVYQPAMGAPPVLGQVTVKGEAKINGTASPSTATVFPGDRVTTETNTVAEMVLNGGSKVLLPATSAVELNNNEKQVIVNLKQGSLAVLSQNDMPVYIDAIGARVKPAAGTAVVLEVAVSGRNLKVLAHRGSATVETLDKTVVVEPGRELDATMAPPAPVPAGTPQTFAAHSRMETWVILLSLAAGATGLALGVISLRETDATPINPQTCTVVSPAGVGLGDIVCP